MVYMLLLKKNKPVDVFVVENNSGKPFSLLRPPSAVEILTSLKRFEPAGVILNFKYFFFLDDEHGN